VKTCSRFSYVENLQYQIKTEAKRGTDSNLDTVWIVDFEMPVRKLYFCLFLPMLPKKKKKREESAATQWCFKVCSPYCTIILCQHRSSKELKAESNCLKSQ
jgi:hypothetical protein